MRRSAHLLQLATEYRGLLLFLLLVVAVAAQERSLREFAVTPLPLPGADGSAPKLGFSDHLVLKC